MTDPLESSIFGQHDPDGGRLGEHPSLHPDEPALEETALEETAPEETAPEGTAPEARAGRRSHRPRRWTQVAVICAALLVVGIGAIAAFTVLRPLVTELTEPNDYPGPGSGTAKVSIEAGAGGAVIAKALVDEDVVKSTKAFIEAMDDEPDSSGIQPGIYDLRTQMRAEDALAILVDPANRITTSVTIPEGLWATEIYAKLSNAMGLPVADYERAVKNPKALRLPASAKGKVEGYLFPASYDFEPKATATQQLKALVAQSVKRLAALGVKPADMERIVIIASIAEAEARKPEDLGKVVRVMLNRLKKDEILGMDSTVNYIFKKHGVPTKAMLKSGSPYNTRRFHGLPPSPIGNPGEAAIKAAVAPPAGNWLYFTTVNLDTGETKFTTDPDEHERNGAEFRAWCKANADKC